MRLQTDKMLDKMEQFDNLIRENGLKLEKLTSSDIDIFAHKLGISARTLWTYRKNMLIRRKEIEEGVL